MVRPRRAERPSHPRTWNTAWRYDRTPPRQTPLTELEPIGARPSHSTGVTFRRPLAAGHHPVGEPSEPCRPLRFRYPPLAGVAGWQAGGPRRTDQALAEARHVRRRNRSPVGRDPRLGRGCADMADRRARRVPTLRAARRLRRRRQLGWRNPGVPSRRDPNPDRDAPPAQVQPDRWILRGRPLRRRGIGRLRRARFRSESETRIHRPDRRLPARRRDRRHPTRHRDQGRRGDAGGARSERSHRGAPTGSGDREGATRRLVDRAAVGRGLASRCVRGSSEN